MESRKLVKNVITETETIGWTNMYKESTIIMELHGLHFTDRDITTMTNLWEKAVRKKITKRQTGKWRKSAIV